MAAEKRGYDVVFLHAGRADVRKEQAEGLSRGETNEIGTYAYLIRSKAAREMSGWLMRHPIDLAIRKAKRISLGVLNGNRRFAHRVVTPTVQAVSHERRGNVVVSAEPSKKLHQVWIQGEGELPEEFKANRAQWRAALPDFEMVLWDEESARKQWPEFAEVSNSCYHHATRADLILARALRDFGGLATGTDCRPNNHAKLRALLNVVDSFIVLTPGREEVSNGLQWSSRANHPFWKCVCNHQLRDHGSHLSRKSVSSATGPRCYHEAFHAQMWDLHVITAPGAFTRDWKHGWTNPDALIDPGFAKSWVG
jgi:hypothetical protein